MERGGRRSRSFWGGIGISLPALYFLSLGPAWWLMNQTSNWTLKVLLDRYFYPAYFVAWNCRLLRDMLEWYCGLFGSR